MKINDFNGLLQEKSTEEMMDLVLEELEVDATEDREPKEMTPDEDNKNLYPADEHRQEEEVEEVIVKEESQTANGPELERAGEMENEATDKGALETMSSEIDNEDLYPSDDHDDAEEVEGIAIKEGIFNKFDVQTPNKKKSLAAAQNDFYKLGNRDAQRAISGIHRNKQTAAVINAKTSKAEKTDSSGNTVLVNKSISDKIKDAKEARAATKDATLARRMDTAQKFQDKVKELTENYSDFELMKILDENGYEATLENLLILKEEIEAGNIVIEDALETEPMVAAAEEKVEDTNKEAETGDLKKAEKPFVDEEDDDADEKDEDDKDEETDDKVEEIIADKETTNEALIKTGNITFGGKQKVGGQTSIDAGLKLNGGQGNDVSVLGGAKSEKKPVSEGMNNLFSLINRINESLSQTANGPELGAAGEMKNEATNEKSPEAVAADKDNKDLFPADEHKQVEEVKEVVFEQNANGPELGAAGEMKNEATDEKSPEAVAADKDNKDVYPSDEHKQAEEVEEVVVKESQTANGPELGAAGEMKNEATDEKAPEAKAENVDNKDLFPADEHKQVEEVVEVVVEAAAACKAKGIKATKENLIKECRIIMAESAANVEDPEKKEFDIDKTIVSKEMTGTEKTEEGNENPTPTDLKESVKYSSIKEACMLDEGYFDNDTYTIQTSTEKKQKLTEQISLLLARENMDPMYDELLKESIHAQRLQEALIRKYSSQAALRARNIYGK